MEVGSILTPYLVNDINTIIQLLPLQEGMKVLQEVHQVFLSITVWNNDGDLLDSLTLFRVILASVHIGVFCLHFLQSEIGFKTELALAFCKRNRAK